MLTSVSDCVQYVSEQLRDQEPMAEFTVWSEALLVNALREGLALIASSDAKAMLTRKDITLQAGIVQTLDSAYESLIVAAQIVPEFNTDFEQKDVSAFKVTAASPVSSNTKWIRPDCSQTSDTWRLERWGWDITFPDRLFVYPAVPNDGLTRKLAISYLPAVNSISDSFTMSQKYYPALIAWMLYRALGSNLESSKHIELSKVHLNVAQALLHIQMPQG